MLKFNRQNSPTYIFYIKFLDAIINTKATTNNLTTTNYLLLLDITYTRKSVHFRIAIIK